MYPNTVYKVSASFIVIVIVIATATFTVIDTATVIATHNYLAKYSVISSTPCKVIGYICPSIIFSISPIV